MLRRLAAPALGLLAGAACSFDGPSHHVVGPYYLFAPDVSAQMALCYEAMKDACDGRIGETVFAAGGDERHVIAKRHPGNDRRRVEYYIIDRSRDGPLADPEDCVSGPYTAAQFAEARRAMGVDPRLDFTVRLRHLE